MRVLHILNELKPSGAETMLQAAASYWQRQGVKSEILATGRIPGTFAFVLEKAGYRIHHIPFSPSQTFLRRVYELFQTGHYDIIHIHTERANFWYAVVSYLARTALTLRTVHNIFPCVKVLRLERYIQRWIMRKSFGVRTIAIGSSVKNTEWRTFKNPTRIISNWFDSNRFKPPSMEQRLDARRKLAITESIIVVTSIGNCWPQKNHGSIIEAVQRLPTQTSVLYLHVGQEMEGCPERKLAEALGVTNHIRFQGMVLDILPILYSSDIYLMPSLYEGFSIAALEAMAAGLPVVLADVPGLRDFKAECKEIYWAEPTAESIRIGIQYFLDMAAHKRQEVGLRLSRYVHEQFAIEKGAEAYLNLYRSQTGPMPNVPAHYLAHTNKH